MSNFPAIRYVVGGKVNKCLNIPKVKSVESQELYGQSCSIKFLKRHFLSFCRLKAFLRLNVCLDKYFIIEVKIFTAWDKTLKSAKVFTLEILVVY